MASEEESAVVAAAAPSKAQQVQQAVLQRVKTFSESFKANAVSTLDNARSKANSISAKGAEAPAPKPPHPALLKLKEKAAHAWERADAVPGVPFVKARYAKDSMQVWKVGMYGVEVVFAVIVFSCAAAALSKLNTIIAKVNRGRRLKIKLAQSWPFVAPRGLPVSFFSADPTLEFAVAAGVMAFVFGGLLLWATLSRSWRRMAGTHVASLLEMSTAALMAIFYLSGAAALASYGTCPSRAASFCGPYNAAQAFAWMSWLLWSASTLICLFEWLRGPQQWADEEAPEAAAKVTVQLPSHIKAVNVVRTNSTGNLTKSASKAELKDSGVQAGVPTSEVERLTDLGSQITTTRSALVRAELERQYAREAVAAEQAAARERGEHPQRTAAASRPDQQQRGRSSERQRHRERSRSATDGERAHRHSGSRGHGRQ